MRMLGKLCAAIVCCLLVVAARGQNVTVPREKVLAKNGSVQTLKAPLPLYPMRKVSGQAFSQVVDSSGRAARVHFIATKLPPDVNNWRVVVIGGNHKTWSYSAAASSTTNMDFWSDEMTAPIVVNVVTLSPTDLLEIQIDKLALSNTPSKPSSITEPDDRVMFNDGNGITDEMREWSKAVGRLRFVGDDGGEYLCTAFLVSPTLMLTNHHCVNTDSELKSALVDFDYIQGVSGPLVMGFQQLVLTDTALDYSLMRLSAPAPYLPLNLGSDPGDGDVLVLIEHPGGEVKQASIIDCKVKGASLPGISYPDTDFGHLCDTLGGSSGSPIIHDGRIVGLHHLGFNPTDASLVNRGVKISRIIADIKARSQAKSLSVAQEMGIQ